MVPPVWLHLISNHVFQPRSDHMEEEWARGHIYALIVVKEDRNRFSGHVLPDLVEIEA
jgi:hypothetical protein